MFTNKSDIQIELDEGSPTYEAGDTIRGAVRTEVNKDCQCNNLILSLEWYTHGRGDTVERRVDQQSLFQGEWTAGGYHFYNFELTVPPGPYTYHGRYLNVDWRLRARADIPWAMSPTDESEVLVEPSGNEDSFQKVVNRSEDTFVSTSGDESVSMWGILFAIPFLIGGLLVLPAAIVSEEPTAWLAALGFLGGGGYILFRSLRNALAEQRLGNVNVHLNPTEAHPGESLRCRVDVEPSGPVTAIATARSPSSSSCLFTAYPRSRTVASSARSSS